MTVKQATQNQESKYLLVPYLPTKSGFITAITHLPYFLFLLFLILTNTPSNLWFLIGAYICTIGSSIYFFEKKWKDGVSHLLKTSKWISKSNRNNVFWMMTGVTLLDSFVEVSLVTTGLRQEFDPALIFALLIGPKIIGAPIQGYVCDLWKRKSMLLFSMFVSVLMLFYLRVLESEEGIILGCLLFKGLLGNVASIVRTIIADEREIEVTG